MSIHKHASADHIELQGPDDPTLTLPPPRRTGLLLASSLVGIALLALVGTALVRPGLFMSAVQAFVGGS